MRLIVLKKVHKYREFALICAYVREKVHAFTLTVFRLFLIINVRIRDKHNNILIQFYRRYFQNETN